MLCYKYILYVISTSYLLYEIKPRDEKRRKSTMIVDQNIKFDACYNITIHY